MRMQGQVWSTLLLIIFTGWCGGADHSTANKREVGENTVKQATPGTISLDFTPMTDPTSTFVSIQPDNQAKAVRYSRSLIVIKGLGNGTISRQDASTLLDKARALANDGCSKSFGTPGLTRGDQFHLTLNLDQTQIECRGFLEDAPATIRSLVENVLSISQKLGSVPLADAYLRSEPISPNRYEALRKLPAVKFADLDTFPNQTQQLLSAAINQPRDFIALSMEQRKTLQDRITNGQEFFVTHKNSGYQLTLFRASN